VVTDAAQGVTMTLKTGTTSMTLTQDLDSIKAAVQGWPATTNAPVGQAC
jgi:flagellar hook-associated protein 2